MISVGITWAGEAVVLAGPSGILILCLVGTAIWLVGNAA
jgi:hypothetical protein